MHYSRYITENTGTLFTCFIFFILSYQQGTQFFIVVGALFGVLYSFVKLLTFKKTLLHTAKIALWGLTILANVVWHHSEGLKDKALANNLVEELESYHQIYGYYPEDLIKLSVDANLLEQRKIYFYNRKESNEPMVFFASRLSYRQRYLYDFDERDWRLSGG
jgi:hypothetical protein